MPQMRNMGDILSEMVDFLRKQGVTVDAIKELPPIMEHLIAGGTVAELRSLERPFLPGALRKVQVRRTSKKSND